MFNWGIDALMKFRILDECPRQHVPISRARKMTTPPNPQSENAQHANTVRRFVDVLIAFQCKCALEMCSLRHVYTRLSGTSDPDSVGASAWCDSSPACSKPRNFVGRQNQMIISFPIFIQVSLRGLWFRLLCVVWSSPWLVTSLVSEVLSLCLAIQNLVLRA